MDLLTVVTHEFGHVLGFGDDDVLGGEVMSAYVGAGSRLDVGWSVRSEETLEHQESEIRQVRIDWSQEIDFGHFDLDGRTTRPRLLEFSMSEAEVEPDFAPIVVGRRGQAEGSERRQAALLWDETSGDLVAETGADASVDV
jgi:hypothetical protein